MKQVLSEDPVYKISPPKHIQHINEDHHTLFSGLLCPFVAMEARYEVESNDDKYISPEGLAFSSRIHGDSMVLFHALFPIEMKEGGEAGIRVSKGSES